MELATTLSAQTVRNTVREAGINPNHWYAVSWSQDLNHGTLRQVVVWHQKIALFRDPKGQLHAIEDACPHRGVELHRGQVNGCHVVCPYHGWEFDPDGHCVKIPYLPADQKLPPTQVRVFPVQEKYGLIWVFPGDRDQASDVPILQIPEYEESGWFMIPINGHFKAHFSICNENTMDVFHGYLHQGLQGWFDPRLLKLEETKSRVLAQYQVSYKGIMAKFLGLAESATQVTTLPITIDYQYPHYATTLQGISSLYLMRLPIDHQDSRSFALFFFRVRLPQWLLNRIQPILVPVLQRFLYRFLAQDKEMIESEQQNYSLNPQRHYAEINPAIIALQRMTLRQYEVSLEEHAKEHS